VLDKNLLAEFKFFSDIPEDKLSAIAQIGNLLEYKIDDILFRVGDTAENLCGVVDGEVELSLVFKDKVLKTDIKYEEAIQSRFEIIEKPIQVALVNPGQIFGWSALVSDQQRTLTARCGKSSRLLSLASDDLRALFRKDFELGYIIMTRLSDIIAKRLRDRTDKLIEAWGEAFEVDEI
jgi:CRP-like cAMP-binding protein